MHRQVIAIMAGLKTDNAENLFRRQALLALAERPYGRPICRVPKPWYWTVLLLLCLAAAMAAFATRFEYSRKEHVRGWLVPHDGVARISQSSAAVVEQLLQAPGARIQSGDAIMILSRNAYLDDGRSSADVIAQELQQQVEATAERIRLLRLETRLQLESDEIQLASVVAAQREIAQQLKQQNRRIESADSKLLRITEAVSKGAATAFDELLLQEETATMRQAAARLRQESIALDGERQRLLGRLQRLPVELQGRIAELRSEQSQLRQQLTVQRSEQRVVVKAPLSGRLASVDVHMGDTIAPRQRLATIVPRELALIAEVYVPSSAIGRMRIGQGVRLKYDAFPYQQFGAFAGRVEDIADVVSLPVEIPQAFAMREATFRVRISIEHAAVPLENGHAKLRSGMLLGAEITVETRTLASWLLEPLRLRSAQPA
jgi:membrane fusion protein